VYDHNNVRNKIMTTIWKPSDDQIYASNAYGAMVFAKLSAIPGIDIMGN